MLTLTTTRDCAVVNTSAPWFDERDEDRVTDLLLHVEIPGRSS